MHRAWVGPARERDGAAYFFQNVRRLCAVRFHKHGQVNTNVHDANDKSCVRVDKKNAHGSRAENNGL